MAVKVISGRDRVYWLSRDTNRDEWYAMRDSVPDGTEGYELDTGKMFRMLDHTWYEDVSPEAAATKSLEVALLRFLESQKDKE